MLLRLLPGQLATFPHSEYEFKDSHHSGENSSGPSVAYLFQLSSNIDKVGYTGTGLKEPAGPGWPKGYELTPDEWERSRRGAELNLGAQQHKSTGELQCAVVQACGSEDAPDTKRAGLAGEARARSVFANSASHTAIVGKDGVALKDWFTFEPGEASDVTRGLAVDALKNLPA